MKKLAPNIVTNPTTRGGKPLVRGTRITVEEVLGFLASGMDYAELKAEYGLTRPQIQAAVAYVRFDPRG